MSLPMFHALTGCDTVSSFVGRGKIKARATWNGMPELTDALLTLSGAPNVIDGNVLHTIERFVIPLYDRTITCKDIDEARSLQNNVTQIEALEQHVKKSYIPRSLCVVSITPSYSCSTSTNELGMDQE